MRAEVVEMPRDYSTLAKDKIDAELKDFSGGQKEKGDCDTQKRISELFQKGGSMKW